MMGRQTGDQSQLLKSAEIWSGTQSPSLLLNDVAKALKIERTNITFHQHFVGGAYLDHCRRFALSEAA